MKRFALLTVLLLVLATLGFADDVLKPGLAFTGGATLSWGIDLDAMTTGFKNETDVAVDLTLVSGFTQEKAGKGDVYGVIKVSDFDLTVNLATDGLPAAPDPVFATSGDLAVEAYIVAGALQVGVYAAPDLTVTKVAAIEANDVAGGDDNIYVVDYEDPAASGFELTGFGTYVQYTAGPVVAKLYALSNGDWSTNTANEYGFGVEGTGTFGPATVGAGFYYGLWAGVDVPLAYVTAAFKQGMFDVSAAFDLALPTAGAVWDAGLGATVTLKEGVTLGVNALLGSDDDADFKVAFTEPAAAGLVDGLGFDVTAYILDVMATMEYDVAGSVSYAVGKFTPKIGFDLGSNQLDAVAGGGEDATADDFFSVNVGVSTAMFDNVTLSATWTSGDFIAPDDANFYAGLIGTFVLAANISF